MAVESSVRLRVDGSSAVRELNRVNKATGALQGAVGKLLSGFAAVDLARRFFKGFAEAEKAAAAVRTLGVDSAKLRRELLGVSNELGGLVSQTELTTAAYDVASAGFTDAAAAANVLKAASLGAVGGLADLGTVADATTSVLNAYGLSSDKASKLVDGFIQTQNDGKIIVAQYAAQIGRVAPVAAAAGVGIEDLNAAISTVTAQGVPVESTFAGIRQIIAGVLKPTAEAAKVAKTLGIEFNTAAIRAKGFGGFLADVVEKTGGSETALTQLFGSVEALSALLPLTNDGLVTFNKNLDNQADSAGAAKDATKELGGTVTSQVTKIVNNIGNVARALDRVLGPALKLILQDINNIISAASTAISKFTDLATGAVSRSAAALQAAASTGFTSESAFVALREAIGTLRPGLAQSEADLLKLEGALDEAGRAALRFSGKGDFGRLRNEVLDTITAMRQLIINRREALGEGAETGGTPVVIEDPEVAALRARVDALLAQLNDKSSSKSTSKTDADLLRRRQQRRKDFEDQLYYQDQLRFSLENQNRIFEDIGQTIQDGLVKGIEDAITGAKSLREALSGVFKSIGGAFLKSAISSAVGGINFGGGGGGTSLESVELLTSGINFFGAEGGYASGATNAVIGEAGPEYLIPENKMRESMARYSRGVRGPAVIPENGEGGTNSMGSGTAVAAPIDVRFSVERINSVDYVTADQFQRGMQQAAADGAKQGEQRALTTLRQNTSQRRRIGL